MQLNFHIRKGDEVYITTGKEKGKTGTVIRVDRKNSRVLIEGRNTIKKHIKPTATSVGEIKNIEASIHISNVMHLDPKTMQPTRIKYKFNDDGVKVRISKKSGLVIDK